MFLVRSLAVAFLLYLLLPVAVSAADPAPEPAAAAHPPALEQSKDAAVDDEAARRDALKKRVLAKWDAMVKRDFDAVYAFTSPAYREAFSLSVFKRKFGNARVQWQSVDVVSMDFKGNDAATVNIKINIVYHDPQSQKSINMATHDQESWVYNDGQWWYSVK